jgi:hypothetical protein
MPSWLTTAKSIASRAESCRCPSINQKIVDPEIAIRGNWAFEIATVESTLTPIRGSEVIRTITTTLVVLRKDMEGGASRWAG